MHVPIITLNAQAIVIKDTFTRQRLPIFSPKGFVAKNR
jgi:hypothetical protein